MCVRLACLICRFLSVVLYEVCGVICIMKGTEESHHLYFISQNLLCSLPLTFAARLHLALLKFRVNNGLGMYNGVLVIGMEGRSRG